MFLTAKQRARRMWRKIGTTLAMILLSLVVGGGLMAALFCL